MPAFAGADRVVEQLLDAFTPTNTYTVYVVRDGARTSAPAPNRRYVRIPALRGKYLRAPSYFLLCCLHFVFVARCSVAHVHNSDFGVFCPLLRLRRGVRIVGTFHGDPSIRDKWGSLARLFLRGSEWAFVRSCDTLTSVDGEKTVAGRVVHYIPNGFTPSGALVPPESGFPYSSDQLSERNYVMFACGRLDKTKGLHHLLAAYREIPTDLPLLVVGDFSHDSKYSDAVSALAANDGRLVLCERLLNRTTLQYVLGRCAVFVFPSDVEAMSMMLLEAIAAAPVVICSDIPANLAVVGEDYPLLFSAGDPASLRAVLTRTLERGGGTGDLERVRDRLRERFRWDHIARDYEMLYAG